MRFQPLIYPHPPPSMPVLPTFENLRRGAACAPVMRAEGRRSRGGRSVASDPGGRRDCRAVSKGAARRLTRKPEDIRPPATTSRARPQGANGTPKVDPQGRPGGPEERWVVERLEASRPMRPGRENRGDATGRPTLEIQFGVPSSPSIRGRGPPRACARGGFRAPDDAPAHRRITLVCPSRLTSTARHSASPSRVGRSEKPICMKP